MHFPLCVKPLLFMGKIRSLMNKCKNPSNNVIISFCSLGNCEKIPHLYKYTYKYVKITQNGNALLKGVFVDEK